ncbi:DUF5928 domain-containing protein [Palleronia abyssalis]|nr:DUF5928 domain-containing protein [Palleronia abyssalis]
MAKIAYLLLCHKDPDAIVAQARRLTSAGDFVAIHFDRRAPQAAFDRMQAELADNPSVAFAQDRLKCGWGAWSLVAATLAVLRTAVETFPRATHFYLSSGDCMPIKSARYCHEFLDAASKDFIEGHDFFQSDWIKTGFKEERLIYRHPFNERTQTRLFYWTYNVQKTLRITRQVPRGLRMMIGSQWWCLRRSTVEALLNLCAERPDILRFFKTTWIPDETFFQTLVFHIVPRIEIENRTPTFLVFSDYGMPVNFYNDHFDLLMGQNYLFARKISPEALDLKKRLGDLYAQEDATFTHSGEGRRVYSFLTNKGREGRRFAPRFWEREATMGLGRELLVLTCKKWHVAKRMAMRISDETSIPAVGYLFNEDEAGLPSLGGIETSVSKRHRHRRALLRLLMDYFETDRLVICADTADLDLLRDFEADRSVMRVLELDCEFDDGYLAGHAQRLGLFGENPGPEALHRLLPTVRADIHFESEAIRDAGFANYTRIREAEPVEKRIDPLVEFLSVNREVAVRITQLPYLFDD